MVGSLMMIALHPTSSPLWAASGAAFIGIGMGLTNNTFQVAVQSAVAWGQRGVATSALVTAGALVALAEGQLARADLAELIEFIDRQGRVPATDTREIADAFDSRIRELAEQYCARVIAEMLRPLAGRSLSSIVLRTAEHVAAADREIHPGELRALKLIGMLMMNRPADRPDSIVADPTAQRLTTHECDHCGAVLMSPIWTESVGSRHTAVIWHCAVCGHEFETTEDGIVPRFTQDELVRAYFPALLVA